MNHLTLFKLLFDFICYSSSSLEFEAKRLSSNTTYVLCVVPENQYGKGPESCIEFTTLAYEVPSTPPPPIGNKFERDSIRIILSPPVDDGSSPILYYSLAFSSDLLSWNVINTSLIYTHTELKEATTYHYKVAAANQIGSSQFSDVSPLSTISPMCGDGICDLHENSSSCVFDCGSEENECPGTPTCSGKGECENGLCQCTSGFYGPDCSLLGPLPIIIDLNQTKPSLDIHGGNSSVSFSMSFLDIQEITPDGTVVASYKLEYQNFTLTSFTQQLSDDSEASSHQYNCTLPNRAVLSVQLMTFINATTLMFGDYAISIGDNGLKYTLEVNKWPFRSLSNRLTIHMYSGGNLEVDDCQQTELGTSVNHIRWMKINVGGVNLYGKFLDFALLDERRQNIQFTYNSSSEIVALTVPHFWDNLVFDPDFQLLVGPPSNKPMYSRGKCEGFAIESSSSINGAIIGISVGAVVGTALTAGLVMLAVTKRKERQTKKRLSGNLSGQSGLTDLRVEAATSSPMEANDNPKSSSNSSPLYNPSEMENPLYSGN